MNLTKDITGQVKKICNFCYWFTECATEQACDAVSIKDCDKCKYCVCNRCHNFNFF